MARAIETEQLSKRYLLGEGGGYRTLREAISAWRPGIGAGRRPRPELWALRDVGLAVDEGESVGVVGRNGAGKSTLLKILSRITVPTSGVSRTRGRVAALLEVGTGFHPELTGRENISLNGALMGMSRRETARRFDAIVEFAELQRFLETPLKRYSTGMALRLAFSIAAHLEPDIVVVDEVLAVGDAEFRRRCVGRMSDLEREGRTVVFVSHDLGVVTQLCRRVIWLDEGRVRMDGHSDTVIREYLKARLGAAGATAASGLDHTPNAAAGMQQVDLVCRASESLRRDEPLVVSLSFIVREPVQGLDVAIYVQTASGVRVLDEAWSDTMGGETSIGRAGSYKLEVTIPPLLAAGGYVIGAWLGTEAEDFFYEDVLRIQITPLSHDRATDRSRIAHPDASWQMISTRAVDG